jgi:hypothetical protein
MSARSAVSLPEPLYIEEGNQHGSFGLLDLDDVHAIRKPTLSAESFLVLSYNILSSRLAADHAQELYWHVPPHVLSWENRRRAIFQELEQLAPDVICLQVGLAQSRKGQRRSIGSRLLNLENTICAHALSLQSPLLRQGQESGLQAIGGCFHSFIQSDQWGFSSQLIKVRYLLPENMFQILSTYTIATFKLSTNSTFPHKPKGSLILHHPLSAGGRPL